MESIAEKKSFAFAVRIVKLYQHLSKTKNEFVLSKQLLRSGTGIGANICEAEHAQSKRDFTSKMSIALKEANESVYWIRLLRETKYLTEEEAKSILEECIELRKILSSIVKTSRTSEAN